MAKIISLALQYRFFVVFLTGLVILAGVIAVQQLPIDAVPDITPIKYWSWRKRQDFHRWKSSNSSHSRSSSR